MRRPYHFAPSSPPRFDWRIGRTLNVGATDPDVDTNLGPSAKLQEQVGFGSNPGALSMFSYVPANLPAGSPLVVVLHGCGQTAAAYDHGAGWSTLAERLNFAILAPEQTRTNNPNGCFNWFQVDDTRRDSGEAASIRQMIARIIADHNLDQERVFVTGLSAGGAMASVMLATYPEVFAGGAIIAGLALGAATNVQEAFASMRQSPSRTPQHWGDLVRRASAHEGPWPKVSVWHGDADMTVNSGNADAIIAQWTDVLGLARTPTYQSKVSGYPRHVWHDPKGKCVLESYTITGMAHGTPILSGNAGDECGAASPFILEAGISSSYRIADFWGLTEIDAHGVINSSDGLHAGLLVEPTSAVSATGNVQPHGWAARRGADLQKVISNALRAAGLMKGQ